MAEVAIPNYENDESSSSLNNIANILSKTVIISVATTLATLPFMQEISNLQIKLRPTPLAFAKTMMHTMPTQLLSGQKRGAISVISKSMDEHEGKSHYQAISAMLLFSQAETLLPAYSRNKAKLLSVNIQPGTNSVHNIRQLFTMGYSIKSASNLLYYSSLLLLSEQLSQQLPIENGPLARFCGGALSGAINAVITHPLSEAHDRLVLKTKVDSKGKITSSTSYRFFKTVTSQVKNAGFNESSKAFWQLSKRVLLMRVVMTTLTFSMIEGLNQLLNNELLGASVASQAL